MVEERLTQEQLAARVDETEKLVTVGAQYKHYKGGLYTVLHVALLEATNEPCVVYRAEYGSHTIFIRPLDDWCAQIEVDGKAVPRFAKISAA
ncbi:MAG TPA: DUF1653 domain-containing protein [Candidatus Saccharimonadales bacterium]